VAVEFLPRFLTSFDNVTDMGVFIGPGLEFGLLIFDSCNLIPVSIAVAATLGHYPPCVMASQSTCCVIHIFLFLVETEYSRL